MAKYELSEEEFDVIKAKLNIENELLTYNNYSTLEEQFEHGNAPDWLTKTIGNYPEQVQNELAVKMADCILNNASDNGKIMLLQDAVDEHKNSMEDWGNETLLQQGMKLIDWSEVVDQEISYSDNIHEINGKYYLYAEDSISDAVDRLDSDIEVSEEEKEQYEDLIGELSDISERFNELDDEDKVRAAISFEEDAIGYSRSELADYYESEYGPDNFESFMSWDEEEITNDTIIEGYNGHDNGCDYTFCREIETENGPLYIQTGEIAWNDNYSALLEASESVLEGQELRDLQKAICIKEPTLLDESKFGEDKDFQKEVYSNSWDGLRHAPNDIKADKEVVMAAVKAGYRNLEYASDELKDDPEVARASIVNGEVNSNVSDRLKNICNNTPEQKPEEVLTTVIELEKQGHEINPNISICRQKESFDMASTLKEELNAPKVEEKSAKDKYLEDFARQNQANTSKTKTGAMKI